MNSINNDYWVVLSSYETDEPAYTLIRSSVNSNLPLGNVG